MNQDTKPNPTHNIPVTRETTPAITSGQSNGNAAQQPRTSGKHHGQNWRAVRNRDLRVRITEA